MGGGNLPVYFQLWLESCRRNPSVDFLVFTDDCTEYNYPDNGKYFFIAPNYVTSEKRMIRTHFKEEKLFEIKRLLKRVQSKVR